jgi:hypothetical protein
MRVNRHTYQEALDSVLQSREHMLASYNPELVAMHAKTKHNIATGGSPVVVMFNDIKEAPSYFNYEIIAHGITPCGLKVTTVIRNIYPSVDVEMVNSIENKDLDLARIKKLLTHPKLKARLKGKVPAVYGLSVVSGKKLIGFSEDTSNFVRVQFKNMQSRTAFIKMLIDMKIPTYNNDISSYYRVVARESKINISGWNMLTGADATHSKRFEYKSQYTLVVDLANIAPFDYQTHATPESGLDMYPADAFSMDNSISMYWDIEQYSSDFDMSHPSRDTRIPAPDVMEDTIFNIGCTFHVHADEGAILNVSIMLGECEAYDDYTTIICDSEEAVIMTFAGLIQIVQPEFIVEFNGSQFDWPNLVGKAKMHNVLEKMVETMSLKRLTSKDFQNNAIEKYMWATDKVKLAADRDQKIANLRLHGYVAYDLRVLLMQMNPTESKSSLKFYLEMYELQGKDDMPIAKLFTYFATGDVKGLGEVAHYCFMDCFRLHQLANRVNLILDRRAVGQMSYTSVFDSFYRANGSKVRNLIVANAIDLGLFYNANPIRSIEDNIKGKYPGALVLKPKRGLINPIMTFKEFCKQELQEFDENIWKEGQDYISKNYDQFFKP